MTNKIGVSTVESRHDDTADDEKNAKAGPPQPDLASGSLLTRTVGWLSRAVVNSLAALFGFLSIVLLMSVLATIPVLQFLSLGYLLEAGARVARSGRFRDGFVGITGFRRVSGILIAGYLLLVPVRILADVRNSAALLEAGSGRTIFLTALTLAISGVAFIHIAWSIYRGGRLRSFCWPAPIRFWRTLRTDGLSGMYRHARDQLWERFVALRLHYYFWLGIRGFAIALVWLALPVTVLVIGSRLAEGPAVLFSLVGSVLLLTVLLYLPFLQLNFARTLTFTDGFRWRLVREQFCRAPFAFWFALVATLVLAVPLYLLKAELIPREAVWLPSLVFVLSIYPSRLFTGWALGRAERSQDLRFWPFRWLARLASLPIVAAYVLIVYLTQYTSWYGVWSLYEQHAILLPVPFLGL